MRPIILFAFVSVVTFQALAAPPSAKQILDEAKTRATQEKKAIFIHFGASWCGWCKRLDAFLDKPEVKPVFEKYFVPVKLVVQESDKNKALENAGADAVLKKLGGPAGLPYSAFLNAQGDMIVNSNRNGEAGQNIGYPAQPNEIDWFLTMIQKAAPSISVDDKNAIASLLRAEKH